MINVKLQEIDLSKVEAISATPKLLHHIVLLVFFVFGFVVIVVELPKLLTGVAVWYDWFFTVMASVALLAVINPQNRKKWVTLAASHEGLYICSSTDGKWYLFLSWRIVKSIKQGVEGINWRGLHVLVDIENLSESEVKEILKLSRSANLKEHEVIIDVSVGVNSYKKMLLRLDHLKII